MKTDTFDYLLPPELIAQYPVEPRDRSRLMVLHRGRRCWEHRVFSELPELLQSGDLLVRNATRVIPARLTGRRRATGGAWEGLFLGDDPAEGTWEILARTRGRPVPGEVFDVDGGLTLVLIDRGPDGRWTVRPEPSGPPVALLERYGSIPLPPYIRKGREGPGDRERYQTVYAREPGSVAAPTAGLHFTDGVFASLRERSIDWLDVTLHVGIGTFRPIEAESIEEHVLHAEWAELSAEAADRLNAQRAGGRRVVAVGTTSARTLETAAAGGRYRPLREATSLYIRPGHEFRGLDALLTNFHLPRSSLLVLLAALIGVDFWREAYEEAIRERYRFYSYGDAMLVLP